MKIQEHNVDHANDKENKINKSKILREVKKGEGDESDRKQCDCIF
mgnify:CR=1 FL=1